MLWKVQIMKGKYSPLTSVSNYISQQMVLHSEKYCVYSSCVDCQYTGYIIWVPRYHMKQMFTVISIVFVAVLANGNSLSVACVFVIIILDMFLINMHLGKHISNYIFIFQDDEQQVTL